MEHNDRSGAGTEDLYQKLMRSESVPFKFDLSAIQPRPIQIVHPCQAFAESANLANWSEVVAAIKAGKIVSGAAPLTCFKSVWNITLFYEQVHKIEGVYVLRRRTGVETFGIISIGLRSSFKPEVIAQAEAEREER